ncbi:MAG: tRNA guanosine(34) transglycosylase Tgt [Ignavibacteriae bacterium HGW-Ignavibacteriae-1]|jgi:queuine tRNA-ribosyltransferase|nr:MAG: tRNA guanosine(34) transglycosylase Tgt [Ignavibacteriae bacterium HGW-Ignavibacteriae-1]
MNEFFTLIKEDGESKARAGLLKTTYAEIETPVFMPVGTNATVKAIQQRELVELDTRIILGNTYHLYLRPGDDTIHEFGGLHKFMNWNRAILTDSGGYQVFSLKDIRKITDDGVEFKSHIDGSKHFFTPEIVVDIQRNLGSDIMMVLDECAPYPADRAYVRKSMNLSLDWAERSIEYFRPKTPKYGNQQFMFGIAQGGMYNDLRVEYLRKMIDLNFDGNAIGGLSVGEPNEMMYEITELSTEILPKDKPRYLMGVGTPIDILECIERGIDMFDCVMPTRNARNGQLFTSRGKINIKNAKYKLSNEQIDPNVDSYASQNFSLGYLRHLFIADEILGLQLASLHNIAFYLWLARTAREKILAGDFTKWKKDFIQIYKGNQG